MQEIDQSLFIQNLENELENQLKEVLEVFQNLPGATLLQPSSTGGWSIAECVEHLNTYYRFYLSKLTKELSQPVNLASPVSFKHSWLGNYFIEMMDIEKSKKKYKAIKKHRPVKLKEPYEILSEFIQHTEDLQALLHQAQTHNLKKIRIGTSISGLLKMNAGDALKFVLTHNKRHIAQAMRNI
jgi:uncharacterized damage-inducible protein DinB